MTARRSTPARRARRPAGAESPYKGLAPFGDSELDALLFFGRERDARSWSRTCSPRGSPCSTARAASARARCSRRPSRGGCAQEPDAEVIVFSSWSGDPVAPLRAAQDAAEAGREAYLILDQFEEYFLYHADEEGEGTLRRGAARAAPPRRPPRERADLGARGRARLARRVQGAHPERARELAAARRTSTVPAAAPRSSGRSSAGASWPARPGASRSSPRSSRRCSTRRGRGRVELGGGRRRRRRAAVTAAAGRSRRRSSSSCMARLWEAERGARLARAPPGDARAASAAREAIVREHLERALERSLPAEQDLAAHVFDHLVTPSGSKIALRAADLAEYAGVSSGELEPRAQRRSRASGSCARSTGGARAATSGTRSSTTSSPTPSSPGGRSGGSSASGRWPRGATAGCSRSPSRRSSRSRRHRDRRVRARRARQRADARAAGDRARVRGERAARACQSGAADSLALALRAARLEPDARSEAVLRQALIESRLRRSLPAAGPVSALQFSSGGRWLLVAGGSRAHLPPRPRRRAATRTFRDPATVTAAALGPGGAAALGRRDGHGALLRSTTSGAMLQTPARPRRRVRVGRLRPPEAGCS